MSAQPLDLRAFRPLAADDAIFAPIISANPDRPYIIAQLGQSLDGRIATPTGASRWINGASALDHLHRLRAYVDAVVVGVGTVLADDPLLTVRRVAGAHPARVVIDPNGRLKETSRCLVADGVRRIVVYSGERTAPCGAEAVVVPTEGTVIDPGRIVAKLFAMGLKRILIEGGASTVSAFLDARMVDRIHLLVAPIILGSGTTGLSLAPIAGLDDAMRPATRVHLLDDGDVLFDCDLRQNSRG